MRFKFSKDLEYQLEAINAVVDIFDTGKNNALTEERFSLQNPSQIVVNELEVDRKKMAANLRTVQERNGIERTKFSDGDNMGATERKFLGIADEKRQSPDFSVEMETGTGKTYVYLRTIFELNRRYGLKKFIILVPSVAIREGVLKTIEQTREHFREIYGVGFGRFAYDSGKLSRVRDFVRSNDIHIMIMTIQSFAGNERLVMRQSPDRFHGERPIDLVAETRPVVIMDEPQNMESDLSRAAIADLKPLFKLRYSATHKEAHNLVYRLTPVDAFRMNLVKSIQVYGVKYLDPNKRVFAVRSIEVRNRKLVASVSVERRNVDGSYAYATLDVRAGDNLYRRTGNNEKYRDLFVRDVNKMDDFIELSDGTQYRIEVGENKEEIFRAQIAETLGAHFRKQEQLGARVKVLSLFFIDRVDNYARGGILARIFEEEFEKLKKRSGFFRDREVSSVHAGYFASKREKGETVFKDTRGDSSIDRAAYDLIMKDKERLLSFDESVSFLFSHSALREGWDNPNIFQICTLRETKSEMRKRQEIGRGLRLPLDVDGNRIADSQSNALTVIANESYEEYVGTLQSEFEEAGYEGAVVPTSNARARITVTTTRYVDDAEFLALWERIGKKTVFNINIDTEKIVAESTKEFDRLDLSGLAITVDRTQVYFDRDNRMQTNFIGSIAVAVPKTDIHIGNIIKRIAQETGLTRSTVWAVLRNMRQLDMLFENPEEFVRAVSLILSQKKEDLLVNESVKYTPIGDCWEVRLFKEFDSYLNRLMESKKSPFTHIEFDSEGERAFAEHLEQSENVKLYTKLPRGFFVDTPIGEYRPDWAIVWHTEDGDRLFLVRETKFGAEGVTKEDIFRSLRPDEQKKILFGESHFKSIGVDFALATKKNLSDMMIE